MTEDELAIRALIDDWLAASAAGDIDYILELMDEDVVFLVAGQQPMRGREAFATAFRANLGKFHIEARSDIQEINVDGSWAHCWNYLEVTITPSGGSPMLRKGHILSVLRKNPQGQWQIYRDANLLMPG